MYFMLRSLFWLAIVVLLLPIGGDNRFKPEDAVGVVSSTVSDLSSFCERNPGTCEMSARAVSVFGHKVSEGARWAFAMASDAPYEPRTVEDVREVRTATSPAETDGVTPTPVRTSTVRTVRPSIARIVPTNEPNTTVIERGTLTADDKAYAWNGQPI